MENASFFFFLHFFYLFIHTVIQKKKKFSIIDEKLKNTKTFSMSIGVYFHPYNSFVVPISSSSLLSILSLLPPPLSLPLLYHQLSLHHINHYTISNAITIVAITIIAPILNINIIFLYNPIYIKSMFRIIFEL